MLDNLHALNYTQITPIQEKSIPPILQKRDIIAQAKTGSGKTAAFGIGMLENININRYRVQSLILCPTRELADQVTKELRRIARFQHNIKIVTLTGGIPLYKQEHSLSHQAHIVVGTPGRVHKLLERGALSLNEVTMVVLDEADRMLEMGFIDQVEEILQYAPKKRQTLCFSATYPETIRTFVTNFLTNPIEVKVTSKHSHTAIKQYFYEVAPAAKIKTTIGILAENKPASTIIFCNTKDACRRVRAELNKEGVHSLALHGDLDQKERTETLIRFANGSSRILVATDVAARGIDISNLEAVINFDLPFETETYVHRIGRTGRAGNKGTAFSIMVKNESFRLEAINEALKESFRTYAFDSHHRETKEFPLPEFVTLSINGGRKQKISAGDILGVLTKKGDICGSDVGKIDRLEYLTFVAIKRSTASKALKVFEKEMIKGKRFLAMIND